MNQSTEIQDFILEAMSNPHVVIKKFMDDDCIDGNHLDERSGDVILGVQLSEVYSDGGGEGGGEDVERVYSLTNVESGVVLNYVQLNGFYTSGYGTEWDDSISIVCPREVIEIRYFPL
jgi:hypothetical protein